MKKFKLFSFPAKTQEEVQFYAILTFPRCAQFHVMRGAYFSTMRTYRIMGIICSILDYYVMTLVIRALVLIIPLGIFLHLQHSHRTQCYPQQCSPI